MAGCLEDPVQVKLWQASTGTLRIKMVFPLRWHAQLYIRRGTRIPAVIYSDEITYLLIHSATVLIFLHRLHLHPERLHLNAGHSKIERFFVSHG